MFRHDPAPFFFASVIGLALLLTAPQLWSEGMFMDGSIYATVARNMSEAIGNFWAPSLSLTWHPGFYEHPPLALGLQSLFFRAFGDHLWVERVYSFLTMVLTGLLMVRIWYRLSGHRSTAWAPLLLWVITPLVFWSYANNMLENTLGIFLCCAVLMAIRGGQEQRGIWWFLGGLCLSAGMLVKGLVALFPLSFPFWWWLFRREDGFGRVAGRTFWMTTGTALPLVGLFLFIPAFREYLHHYWEEQLVQSFASTGTVSSRWAIVGRMIREWLPALGLVLFGIMMARRHRIPLFGQAGEQERVAGRILLALAVSGVLPLMISLKQRGFYIVPALPFLALGTALFLHPLLRSWMQKLSENVRSLVILKGGAMLLLAAGIGASVFFIGRTGRDERHITAVRATLEHVPAHTTIGTCPSLVKDWGLMAYYYRLGYISFSMDTKASFPFFLVRDGVCPVPERYEESPVMDTLGVRLFRQTETHPTGP